MPLESAGFRLGMQREPRIGRCAGDRKEVEREVKATTGGCACGAIRYEVSSEPLMAAICHCKDCQRTGGGPYAGHSFVPSDAFRLTKGEPGVHEATSESGHTVGRAFCRDCGSALYARSTSMPDAVAVRASSLDDGAAFRPTMHVFAGSAPAWALAPHC